VAQATIDAAWNAGIRLFDTAHLYGGGLAEERLGRALAGRPRDAYRIATKIGCYRPYGQGPIPPGGTRRREADVWDYGYDRTLAAVETSLRRLAVDRLDIVHIHGFDQHIDAALGGAYRALARLKAEKIVGAIGAGCDAAAPLVTALGREPFDVVLCAGRYTLLDRAAAAELLPLAMRTGTRVIAGGVFNSGILATGATRGAHYNYNAASPETVARVQALDALCRDHGATLRAAAVQFPLRNPAIDAILLGAANPAELQDSLECLARPISQALWVAIGS
jgi:D-threo-aldose 1-dehydrogenase